MQYWQRLHEYLQEIDEVINRPIEITLIGGAALILGHHHIRVTYDIDVLNSADARELCDFLQKHKVLYNKYKLPIQIVDASFFPLRDDFLNRRKKYSREGFKNLRVFILDIYDLILSKLDRCDAKDRDDIGWMKDNFAIGVDELIVAYKNGRLNALNADRVDGNFLYILEVVFGKRLEKDDLVS